MPTILHLSDLHFGTDHYFKEGDGETLRSVLVRDVKGLGVKPDCVVISGDLTTHGEPDGLTQAARFVRHLSGDLGVPVASFVIVPGNHDVQWPAIEERKKTPHKARDLALAGLESYKKGVVEELFPRVRDEFLTTYWTDQGLFVLGLNSCHFEGADHAGVGYVDPEQLKRARDDLGDKWEHCATRIAVLHHHLVPVTHTNMRPDPADRSLTLNAPDILSWLASNGFNVVLHGHQHQPFCAREVRYMKSGGDYGVIVLGAGSASVRAERLGRVAKNHYQIIEFTSGRAMVRSRAQHSDSPGDFEVYQDLDLPVKSLPVALARSVRDMGLCGFLWFDQVQWEPLFEQAKDVEVFALSARFLLDHKIETLRGFLRRDGTRLTLFVYDPKVEDELALFDDHFKVPHGDRRTKIEGVLREIEALRAEPQTRGQIDVRLVRGPLLLKYTYYRFDDLLLYVPYRISSYRSPAGIPVFAVRSGTLEDRFFAPDRKFLLDNFPPL
jgi:3',5'-cyclic AMP phosphodiesterase CpdA